MAGGVGHVRPGINVSDRKENWSQNYRVPDVAVFLETGSAENCDAFWFGGPDFAVEVISPGDKTQEKTKFYGKVRVRELMLINREPWELHLMRLQGERLETAGRVGVDGPPVVSEVLPFQFSLRAGARRPTIHVIHGSGKSWDV